MSKQQAFGKRVGLNLYLHVSSMHDSSRELQSKVIQASQLASLKPGKDFNVIKTNKNGSDLSLLDYPEFFEQAFPLLNRYWSFNLEQETFRFRTYKESVNPPVLHRKELLLPDKHPDRHRFASITKEAETIGLFDEHSRIGFLQEWETLLKTRGYKVIGNEILPIGNEEIFEEVSDQDLEDAAIQRHLTALSRTNLSAPMQTLARFGYLDGEKTIFDYGCGRGSDIAFLKEHGIQAKGWDPFYAAQQEKKPADIVNLGFVINVIEDQEERSEALKGAFELTKEWLVVSAMLEHSNTGNGKPYSDGVLTSRSTFQKYYSQAELGQYIHNVLDTEPHPVGPGVYYVFKDKNAEQRFSTQRVAKRRPSIQRHVRPISLEDQFELAARRNKKKYEANADVLEPLWERWLQLGREPKTNEIANLDDIRKKMGSYPNALKLIIQQKGPEATRQVETAAQVRIDDLSVYFAQLKFSRKRPPRPLEPSLKEDIKSFFGNQENAKAHGEELLLSILNKEKINTACAFAAEQGLGWLNDGHSLQLHTSLVSQLPPILRTYVHCATSLYGDVTSADLVKIHIRSGKLTLMTFDDFEGLPLPRMIERIKINLMNQRLDFFDYGDLYTPPYLYRKSRYMNEDCEGFSDQQSFDEALESIGIVDLEGYGPSPDEFDVALERHRYCVKDFQLKRSQTIPDIDSPCGSYLTYRQLIRCGSTQKETEIQNFPQEPDTFTALLNLAVNLLDPIIDYFGIVKLTYGFCSPELARRVPRGVAPKLDQHAAHEVNRAGNPICTRGGAAVDFLVEFEDMAEVSYWIAENLPFDRMYIYGSTRPIHLSYSDALTNQVTIMSDSKTHAKRIPKTMSLTDFLTNRPEIP